MSKGGKRKADAGKHGGETGKRRALNLSDPEAAKDAAACEEPAHSCEILRDRKICRVRVTLVRVPDKFIRCDARETEFEVDTTGHSKKYYAKFSYPHGIRVNGDNPVGVLSPPGILTIDLPIVDWGDLEPPAKLSSKQGKRQADKKRRAAAVTSAVPLPPSIAASEEIRTARGKAQLDASPNGQSKSEKAVKRVKKPKKLLVEPTEALRILDQVAQQQEEKSAAIQERTTARLTAIERKEQARLERKKRRQEAEMHALKEVKAERAQASRDRKNAEKRLGGRRVRIREE